MTGPYRESPRLLLCPRCGDRLEQVANDVQGCLSCDGIWLGLPTIELAFGTRRWPSGASAWWKRELSCPVCTARGGDGVMDAMFVGETMIDRCANHGVWLDHGELGRLLGAPANEELAMLQRRLALETTAPALAARRAERSADDAERSRAASQTIGLPVPEPRAPQTDLAALRAVTMAEVEAHEATLARLRGELRDAETALREALLRLRRLDDQLAGR